MINRMNNLKKATNIVNFVKMEDLELKVSIELGRLAINVLKEKTTYYKEFYGWHNVEVRQKFQNDVRNLNLEDPTNGFEKLKKYLKDFESYEEECFNPFFKKLEGKIEIKRSKITKTQIKKLLKHKDTVVTAQQCLTDDYIGDVMVNFCKGNIVDNLEMLIEVGCSDVKFSRIKNNEIYFFTCGYANNYKISNKNLVLK